MILLSIIFLLFFHFVILAPTLTQISYGSTAIELSDKLNYPRFFRTVPSDIHQAEALADIVKMYKWKKVLYILFALCTRSNTEPG
jgi:ABC-type branched-subunit amino acid transport system substrate-binding protein